MKAILRIQELLDSFAKLSVETHCKRNDCNLSLIAVDTQHCITLIDQMDWQLLLLCVIGNM